jgi:hypothetical protein
LETRNKQGKYIQKGKLVLTSCSGPSLCIVGSVPHFVGTAWAHRGHSAGTPAVANSWPLPRRVLLGPALPLNRLLGAHHPVAGPEHGTVLVLVVINPHGELSTYCIVGRGRPRGACRANGSGATAGVLVQVEGDGGEPEVLMHGEGVLQTGLGQVSGGFIQGTGVEGVLVMVD